ERQALRNRKLPGGLGDHDGRRSSPRTVWADYCRRIAAFLLGRRARQESHALFRRIAGRQLDHRLGEWPRPRQIRWRMAGREFREPEPGKYAMDQAVQSLFEDRYRGSPVSGI